MIAAGSHVRIASAMMQPMNAMRTKTESRFSFLLGISKLLAVGAPERSQLKFPTCLLATVGTLAFCRVRWKRWAADTRVIALVPAGNAA